MAGQVLRPRAPHAPRPPAARAPAGWAAHGRSHAPWAGVSERRVRVGAQLGLSIGGAGTHTHPTLLAGAPRWAPGDGMPDMVILRA